MRLIKQQIDRKDGSGSVTLLPEEPEDMWHAYNLIRPNDLLRASAIRKVTTETATGSTTSTRIHMNLTIRVLTTDFDPQASALHVSGRVAEENKYVKQGGHHTLDLELQRNFTLEKAEGWDSVALEILKEAIDPAKKAQIYAVVMHEGLANICLITEFQTLLRQRVEVSVPRKRTAHAGDHDKGLSKFFKTTLDTLLRHVDLENPKPILLASPGFTAAAFFKFVMDTALSTNNKALVALKPSFIIAHSSSGHLHALNEVLKSKEVLARLSDTKFARETKLIDDFFTLVRKDDGRACYGPAEVVRAVEKGAVGRGGGVLLISNALFRSQDPVMRRKWVALVDQVKEQEGGEVRVLSSAHESGRRLDGVGGVAAILTFPLEFDDEEEEEVDQLANGVSNVQV